MFDWRQTLRAFMQELGYEASILCGQLSDAPVPLLAAAERFPVVLPIEEAVLPFIRKYIDLGKPVLYFDTLAAKPYIHEWALIYGYDDERRVVYVTDAMRPEGKTLPYEEIAENPLRFLAGIDGRKDMDVAAMPTGRKRQETERAMRALRFAVQYARKGCEYRPMTIYLSYTSGLAAYDRWIGYLRGRGPTPNRYGMGQMAAVYGDARRHASRYLRGIALQGEPMRLTLLAAEAYEQAAEGLEAVGRHVPFERNSALLEPETLIACAELLEQAKEFEAAAVGYLEKAIAFVEEREQGRGNHQ